MLHSLRMQAGLLVRAAASPVQTSRQLHNPSMRRGFHAYWVELRRAALIDLLVLLVLYLVHPMLAAGAVLLVLVAAAICYMAGLMLMAVSQSPLHLDFSAGLLIGLGLSGATFGVVMGVVGEHEW